MLKILQISDNIDNSLHLDPSQLTGDAVADLNSAYVKSFVAGTPVTMGADGFVKIATDGDSVIGLLVNDAAGIAFENTPAIASGIVPALTGGLVWSDVVAGDVVTGAKVYVNAGKITGTAPAAGSSAFGIAIEGNTATDGAITFRFSSKF